MSCQWARETLLPPVDAAVEPLGLYTTYELDKAEFVASVGDPVEAVVGSLEAAGYEENCLAALKYHPEDTAATDDGSYRLVPEEHPDLEGYTDTDGTPRLVEEWAPEQCQYHVHVFDMPNWTDVFSHYELRPDIVTPSFSPGRLREHYKPTYGETYFPGVVSPVVEELGRPEPRDRL